MGGGATPKTVFEVAVADGHALSRKAGALEDARFFVDAKDPISLGEGATPTIYASNQHGPSWLSPSSVVL